MPKADGPIVVEAHSFVLRGASGRRLAMLTANEDDEAYLCFNDRRGRPRIAIGFTKDDECRMMFLDEDGAQRINIAFLPNGQAAIMAMGGPGKPAVGIRGGWDEGCGVVGISGQGNVRLHAGIDGNGYPNVYILNPDGTIVFRAVQPEGTRSSKGGIIVPDGPKMG